MVLQFSIMIISRELTESSNSGALSQDYSIRSPGGRGEVGNSSLCLNSPLRWFQCILEIENHCSKWTQHWVCPMVVLCWVFNWTYDGDLLWWVLCINYTRKCVREMHLFFPGVRSGFSVYWGFSLTYILWTITWNNVPICGETYWVRFTY